MTKQAEAATAQAQPAIIVLPKITVKDVGANPQAVLAFAAGSTEQYPLMRAYGVVSGIKRKQMLTDPNDAGSKMREFEALMGDFRAICTDPNSDMRGQRFRSALLYLPEGIHEMLSQPVKIAAAQNEIAEITFGFDIYTRRTGSLAGYGYGARVLGEGGEENETIAEFANAFIESTPTQALLS